eukprot:366074-Chlamydomonas_euryale.AAC.7
MSATLMPALLARHGRCALRSALSRQLRSPAVSRFTAGASSDVAWLAPGPRPRPIRGFSTEMEGIVTRQGELKRSPGDLPSDGKPRQAYEPLLHKPTHIMYKKGIDLLQDAWYNKASPAHGANADMHVGMAKQTAQATCIMIAHSWPAHSIRLGFSGVRGMGTVQSTGWEIGRPSHVLHAGIGSRHVKTHKPERAGRLGLDGELCLRGSCVHARLPVFRSRFRAVGNGGSGAGRVACHACLDQQSQAACTETSTELNSFCGPVACLLCVYARGGHRTLPGQALGLTPTWSCTVSHMQPFE